MFVFSKIAQTAFSPKVVGDGHSPRLVRPAVAVRGADSAARPSSLAYQTTFVKNNLGEMVNAKELADGFDEASGHVHFIKPGRVPVALLWVRRGGTVDTLRPAGGKCDGWL